MLIATTMKKLQLLLGIVYGYYSTYIFEEEENNIIKINDFFFENPFREFVGVVRGKI